MHVLVLNSGSSSLKHRLFDLPAGTILASGLVERIGEPEARVRTRVAGASGDLDETVETRPVDDHAAALSFVVAGLDSAGLGGDIAAIGHRVVHGGERFVAPTVVDDAVVEGIRAQIPLAPLHNPANLRGIEVARALRPDVWQVAVFDTAFHRTLPAHAYRYAVPRALYERYGVRRYGFHGTSHAYVARRAAEFLERPISELSLVTAHLGNGASITAVAGGRSVDTSMGLSPLEGLVMGTRSGDLDPAVVFHLHRQAGMAPQEIETLLNSESGLRGLCGDNDVRTVERRAADGDADARLALEVYAYRIRKYVGAYAAVLGGLDALVLTAGVGENSSTVRALVAEGLSGLGIAVSPERNAHHPGRGVLDVSAPQANVRVLVVPTDEELEIASQTVAAVQARSTI